MYGWNVERALSAAGIPFCTSDQQGPLRSNMDDLQTRADYVTYAIRQVHALAGRRIAIVGHSQGGMIARWSLRFWPDTRSMVEKVIGVAADNHGTTAAGPACTLGCAASWRQQGPDSNVILALNSITETFPGIDYTEIYSHTDELVTPDADSTGTSSLHGAARITNVAVQDVCPTDNPDHMLLGTTDPVSWALIKAALDHGGPTDPERIPRSVCAQDVMPGVDNPLLATDIAAAATYIAQALGYPHVPAEPPLRCYVTATCPGAQPTPRSSCRSRRLLTMTIPARVHTVTRATLDGRSAHVVRRGRRRVIVLDLRGRTRGRVTLTIIGRDPRGRVIREVRRVQTCVPRRGSPASNDRREGRQRPTRR
jgi:pimeloyl-ACP methyl ester carboxylesterase